MVATFTERSQEIMDRVGGGVLTGTVVVDQIYAFWQHENMALKHPHGGGAKYLGGPLMQHYLRYMDELAKTVLDDGGVDAMIDITEDLCEQVELHAPLWFNDLRRSGHPIVSNDGVTEYDRPPAQHRLSEEEIDVKKRLDPSGWITKHGDHIYVGTEAEHKWGWG